jgi:hypothetical protein
MCAGCVRRSDARRRSATAAAALFLLAASAACHANAGKTLKGKAADEWTRSLPLSENGEVQLSNRNGRIEVEGVAGSTVDIRVERIVHAATEKSAHDLLGRIAMEEQASPDRVTVRTQGIPGILIGVSVDVIFHVRMPATARVRAEVSNGDVTVRDISGGSVMSATNGRINGSGLGGGVAASSVNGKLEVEMAAIGDEPVSMQTTNGSMELKLPADANGTVDATTVNGQLNMLLPFTPMVEQDGERRRGRRMAGRINAGGTSIQLHAVNGSITVRPR